MDLAKNKTKHQRTTLLLYKLANNCSRTNVGVQQSWDGVFGLNLKLSHVIAAMPEGMIP